MQRIVRALLAAWLAALLSGSALAAPDWSALAQPSFRHLGFDQGLPHPIVTALAQDAQGLLWIGTQGGLARFDGFRLRVFRPGEGEGALPDANIQALHLDSRGRLWVATSSAGLLRFEPARQRFVPEPAVPLRAVLALADEGEVLWLAGEAGLLRLQQGRVQAWSGAGAAADALRAPQRALLRARDGSLWVGGALGLVRIHAGQAVLWGALQGVSALAEDADGTLWVGSANQGLSRVQADGGLVSVWSPQHPQLAGRGVAALLNVAPGEFWVAGYGQGLARYPGPAGGLMRHDPFVSSSLASNGVRVLFKDRTGLVWVGGDQGLNWHDPAAAGFLNLLASPQQPLGLAERNVTHIGVGPAPQHWLLGYGARGLGLLHTPGEGPARLQALALHSAAGEPPLDEQRVLATAWRHGLLWVGTHQGLYRVDWGTRRAQRVPLPLPQAFPRIEALLPEPGGALWIGTVEGLLREQQGRFELFRQDAERPDSLVQSRVNTLLLDRRGRLWVGTKGGLALWLGGGRFRNHRHEPARADSLCHADAVSLREDGQGRLWIATLGGGLCRLDDEEHGRFRRFGRADGLPHDNIGGLLLDAQGQLWGSSADGLFRFDPKQQRFRVFGLADGVAIRSYWVDSAARTGSDELLFGGGGGLVVVRPERVVAPSALPLPVLSGLRVEGRPQALPDAQGLRLAPRSGSWQVEFAVPEYRAPERLSFRYRLQGLEEHWTETDPRQRLAAFGRLPPGRYSLQLQARHPNLAPVQLELPVQVLPAWWQTWWAQVLALLAAGLVVLALVQLRTFHLQQRQQALEAQVAQRTRELSAANATLARSADTLRLLGDTGKALTAQLDLQAICATLHRQLAQLVPVDAFGVALLEPDGRLLRFPYYFEDRLVQGDTVSLDDPQSLSARAFREDRELDVLDEHSSESAPEVAGIEVGEPMRSLVFRPLTLNEQRIGIVTMQSRRAQAYGAQELDIFRSLVAYAAIAIGNARAFIALQQAQDQLVEHAKLASLGQLVAGVAHEVNTPLGIAVTAGSHLLERARAVRAELQEQRLSRSALTGFLAEAERTAQVLEQNLRRAAGLIEHFKEVSVDRTSDGQRRFELGPYLEELLESLRPSWKHRSVTLDCEVEPGLWMDSFPGALGQVISNLVQNALLHAFAPEQAGHIRIRAGSLGPDQLRLEVADDGRGIPPDHLAQVFDPFFTTKRGQGGTGLGLHISYNLVVQKLQGQIRVHSLPGQGCRFELLLPCVLAPAGEAGLRA